jgi:hypothetical protein
LARYPNIIPINDIVEKKRTKERKLVDLLKNFQKKEKKRLMIWYIRKNIYLCRLKKTNNNH